MASFRIDGYTVLLVKFFLPNFTTKTGGSGVGLSLTYNIVQAAEGTISFESQENVGTEFTIELPK